MTSQDFTITPNTTRLLESLKEVLLQVGGTTGMLIETSQFELRDDGLWLTGDVPLRDRKGLVILDPRDPNVVFATHAEVKLA